MLEKRYLDLEYKYIGSKLNGGSKVLQPIEWYEKLRNSRNLKKKVISSFESKPSKVLDEFSNERVSFKQEISNHYPKSIGFSQYETINSKLIEPNFSQRKIEKLSLGTSWQPIDSIYTSAPGINSFNYPDQSSVITKKHEDKTMTAPQTFIDPNVEQLLQKCKNEMTSRNSTSFKQEFIPNSHTINQEVKNYSLEIESYIEDIYSKFIIE